MKLAKEEDGTLVISAASIKHQKQNMLSLLFYGRGMNMILLVLLSTLVSTKSHGTKQWIDQCYSC